MEEKETLRRPMLEMVKEEVLYGSAQRNRL